MQPDYSKVIGRELICKSNQIYGYTVGRIYKIVTNTHISPINALVYTSTCLVSDYGDKTCYDIVTQDGTITPYYLSHFEYLDPKHAVSIQVSHEPKCECGKEKHKFTSHSDWCKLYKPRS